MAETLAMVILYAIIIRLLAEIVKSPLSDFSAAHY